MKFPKKLITCLIVAICVFIGLQIYLRIYFNENNYLHHEERKKFRTKIDSLENCIQNYEQRAEQERIYRHELYQKRDSLEDIIVLYGLHLPSLQELKRTRK